MLPPPDFESGFSGFLVIPLLSWGCNNSRNCNTSYGTEIYCANLRFLFGGSTAVPREKANGKSDHETRGGRGSAQGSRIFPFGRRIARVRAACAAVGSEELRCQISARAGPPRAGASRDHW